MPIPFELPPQHVFTPDSAQAHAWGIDTFVTQEEQIQGNKFKFLIKDGALFVLAIDPTATNTDLAAEIKAFVAPSIDQVLCEAELRTNPVDRNLFTYDGKVNTVAQSTYSRIYSPSCVDATLVLRENDVEETAVVQLTNTPIPPTIEATNTTTDVPVTIFNFENPNSSNSGTTDQDLTTVNSNTEVKQIGQFLRNLLTVGGIFVLGGTAIAVFLRMFGFIGKEKLLHTSRGYNQFGDGLGTSGFQGNEQNHGYIPPTDGSGVIVVTNYEEKS